MIYIDDSEPEGVLEPAFPYRDVTIKRGVDAKELYEILSEVGRGKFGTVYKCREKSTNLKLAAKFVPIPKREDKRNVEREVEIMNSLQHHLIIQLYAAYEHQKMMCVVLELIGGGELFDRVVDDEFVLTERVCVVFIRQVCEAMEFVHRNNILHLDLKPENILCLTQEGNRIKIIDFGLARKFDPDKRLQILFGTPEFVAPEVVNFDCISYGTDMWSVGVICYVLISGLSPFMGETDIETMANVTIAKYDFEDESFSNVSPECLDFIGKLLVKDLSTRMTASQCLEHKWLQQRPKAPPISTPKPLNVPPPKLKTASSSESPIILADKNDNLEEAKELDTTKDNLKNFIERWEEHPNSPYVFDVEGNVIAPLSETAYTKSHGPDSLSSSRVCSPSPCESIETLTDDEGYACGGEPIEESLSTLNTPINESHEKEFPKITGLSTLPTTSALATSAANTPTTPSITNKLDEFTDIRNGNASSSRSSSGSGVVNPNLQQRSIKSYLHTFDRRNSDTNYLLGRRASGERVNLADEIRKLSDHLLMLAQINTKLGNERGKDDISNRTYAEMGTFSKPIQTDERAFRENNVKSTSSSCTHKSDSTSSTTVNITKTDITNSKTNVGTSLGSATTKSGKANSISSLSMRLQQSIEETPKLTNGISVPWKPMKKSTINTITTANTTTTRTKSRSSASEAISLKRAKFRINQKSRDVPIGLPDTHQTVNLEEAANTTKDCLLHLLEKYNDETKCRNPMGRHQSISVDWNVSDNLEYRSMSSINAFFQRHNNTGEHVKQLQAQLEEKTGGK